MKWMLLLLLPALALADDESRVSAARDLAQGHSIDDQVLVGNALVKLQALACGGDTKAAELLGQKYFSGHEEFERDVDKAEPYLRYAADNGDAEAAVQLVLLNSAKAPTEQTISEARKWMLVASYVDGNGSVPAQIANSAYQVLVSKHPEILANTPATQLDVAMTIHRIRNRLSGSIPPPCKTAG